MSRIHSQTNRYDGPLFKNPHYLIHGFQQCCSAAILHGLSATQLQPYQIHYNDQQREEPPKFSTLKDYFTWARQRGCEYALPIEYVYATYLEGIWTKAVTGEGGTNMYASSKYATKTWFIADRKRPHLERANCWGFMKWLESMPAVDVGTCKVSPLRDGAHGGRCAGAVYAPNTSGMRKFIKQRLKEAQAHAQAVYDEYIESVLGEGVPDTTDEIGQLWSGGEFGV